MAIWVACGGSTCGSATHRSVDLFGIQLMDWVERSGWNNVTLQASSISIICISLTSMYPFSLWISSKASQQTFLEQLLNSTFINKYFHTIYEIVSFSTERGNGMEMELSFHCIIIQYAISFPKVDAKQEKEIKTAQKQWIPWIKIWFVIIEMLSLSVNSFRTDAISINAWVTCIVKYSFMWDVYFLVVRFN